MGHDVQLRMFTFDRVGLIRFQMVFRSVAKSGTLSLNEMMGTLAASGRQVYKFGFGESPFSPPPRVQAALQSARGRAEYTAVAGLPELREKIAAFHCEIDGYPIDMAQVLVAPGTKPLLYNVMQAFRNAEVYLPEPTWVSYAAQASMAGHCVNRVPTSWENRWRVAPDLLDEIIARCGREDRAKLMLLTYPGNPDGLSYTRSELLALAEVLREHGVWVVSDEIYGLLHHRGEHVSLASLYPERTLVTTGLSKWCGAGGWRLGALILPPDAPGDLRAALVGLGSEIYSCASAPVQVAALTAYEMDGELQGFLAEQRLVLSAIGNAIHAALTETGVRAHPPQGGFYLLLDFRPFADALAARGINDDEALCRELLKATGVALLPGSAFAMDSKALTARLAYVDFDGDAALLDAQDPAGDVLAHAKKMLEGIEALRNWLLN